MMRRRWNTGESTATGWRNVRRTRCQAPKLLQGFFSRHCARLKISPDRTLSSASRFSTLGCPLPSVNGRIRPPLPERYTPGDGGRNAASEAWRARRRASRPPPDSRPASRVPAPPPLPGVRHEPLIGELLVDAIDLGSCLGGRLRQARDLGGDVDRPGERQGIGPRVEDELHGLRRSDLGRLDARQAGQTLQSRLVPRQPFPRLRIDADSHQRRLGAGWHVHLGADRTDLADERNEPVQIVGRVRIVERERRPLAVAKKPAARAGSGGRRPELFVRKGMNGWRSA